MNISLHSISFHFISGAYEIKFNFLPIAKNRRCFEKKVHKHTTGINAMPRNDQNVQNCGSFKKLSTQQME